MSDAAVPASVPASEAVPTEKRWVATVTPLPKGEGAVDLRVTAEGVRAFEVGMALLKLATLFLGDPNARIPTETECRAQAAEQALTKEHPAVRMAVKDGKQVWLGSAAVDDVLSELTLLGWVDAGAVPAGVVRGCDYARDPNAFKAAYLVDEA